MLDKFDRYGLFLQPLLQNDQVGFCQWNREEKSLNEMVPDLYNLIAKEKEWRAIVINPDGRQQKNPFDYTGFVEEKTSTLSLDYLLERRLRIFDCYEKATQNPLMKLQFALFGMPQYQTMDDKELYQRIITGEIQIGEVMLRRQLDQLDISSLCYQLQNYEQDKLLKFVSEVNCPLILQFIKEKDCRGILELLDPMDLIPFIKMIGGDDPRYTDPEYLELVLERTKKDSLLKELLPAFKSNMMEPKEVICLALRTHHSEIYDQKVLWSSLDEQKYSRFSDYNLYSEKARYMVFDVKENSHKQFNYDLIRFLSLVLILGSNPIPSGVLSKQRLYLGDCLNDTQALSQLILAYDEKLFQTIKSAVDEQAFIQKTDQETVSSDEFIKLLETTIPVVLEPDKNKHEDLKVETSEIGLAKDCPGNEKSYFESQYASIHKGLREFLKQPRRSLIQAVKKMSEKSSIDNEEAMYLNPFQQEDLVEDIERAEQEMVSTVTSNIYNLAQYTKEMETGRKEVDKKISTRMTKKTIVRGSLIVLAAFLLSFLPLLITTANTPQSFMVSLIIIGILCGLLLIIGLICLLCFKRGLMKRFRAFNQVMNNITNEVYSTMSKFSLYLTSACKMMRGYSVLNRIAETEKLTSKKVKIIEKHIQDMTMLREEYRLLFNEIGLSGPVDSIDIEEYEYDFTILTDYTYELPFDQSTATKIEFLQEGYQIELPINYIKKITLKREEIFDD